MNKTKNRKENVFTRFIAKLYRIWFRAGFVFRFFLGIVLLLFGVFIYLMARQAEIVKLGYQNALKEIKISRLNVEMVQRQEEISRNLDFNTLRERANLSGLSVPQESQVIATHINKRNFVTVTDAENTNHDILDSEIQTAMLQVGSYYEKLAKKIKDKSLKTQENVVAEQELEEVKAREEALERVKAELEAREREEQKKDRQKQTIKENASNITEDTLTEESPTLLLPGMRGTN